MTTENTHNEMFEVEFFDHTVRVKIVGKASWLAGIDICEALGIKEPHQAMAELDEDECGLFEVVDENGQTEKIPMVSEPGIWMLMLCSNTPRGRALRRGLNHEILPAIRKQGGSQPMENIWQMMTGTNK